MIVNVPVEHSSLLFMKEQMSRVKSYVLYNTTINSVSDFYYDNIYWIVVTRLKTKKLDSLPTVYVKQGKPKLTNGRVYAGFDIGYFTLNMLPDSGKISSIMMMLRASLLYIYNNNNISGI